MDTLFVKLEKNNGTNMITRNNLYTKKDFKQS